MSTESGRSLGSRIAFGAFWMVLLRLCLRSIGLVSTVILARLLVPEDFGLVTLAVSIVALLDLMAEFSLDLALIQKSETTREHYDTAWTLLVIKGLLIGLVLTISAGSVASFFGDERLTYILYAVSIVVVAEGFQNIGVVNFRKDMHFSREFRFLLVPKIVSFCVTIALAVELQNYWALVAGILVERFGRVAMSYVMHPFRPRFSLREFRSLFSFSKWMVVSNIAGFAGQRSDTFVVGKVLGANSVGLYSVSLEIAVLPTSELIWPLMRVVFPAYSKISNDRRLLADYYVNVTAIVVALALPVVIGIAILASDIVAIFLGPNWLAAIPLIQILAVYGFLRAMGLNSYSVFMALGRPQYVAAIASFNAVVVVTAVYLGAVNAGLQGVIIGIAAASSLFAAISIFVTLLVLSERPRRLLSHAWRPLVSAVLMGWFVLTCQAFLIVPDSVILHLPTLLMTVFLGALVYAAAEYSLWRICGRPEGPEKMIVDAMASAAKRVLPAVSRRFSGRSE